MSLLPTLLSVLFLIFSLSSAAEMEELTASQEEAFQGAFAAIMGFLAGFESVAVSAIKVIAVILTVQGLVMNFAGKMYYKVIIGMYGFMVFGLLGAIIFTVSTKSLIIGFLGFAGVGALGAWLMNRLWRYALLITAAFSARTIVSMIVSVIAHLFSADLEDVDAIRPFKYICMVAAMAVAWIYREETIVVIMSIDGSTSLVKSVHLLMLTYGEQDFENVLGYSLSVFWEINLWRDVLFLVP